MQKSNVLVKEEENPDPQVNLYSLQTSTKFDEIARCYKANNYWGLLTSLDTKKCSPELIRSADAIKQYVIELCEIIKMKRFQDTVVVHFGEDEKVAGYSMIQLIETSLISGHFANISNNAYIDIFSCKVYDPYEAASFTKKYFCASDVSINICYRE